VVETIPLVRLSRAARMLGVSRERLHWWVLRGRVRAVRTADDWGFLIPTEEIERLRRELAQERL
jgi:predicted site-specific integrase-resolvase